MITRRHLLQTSLLSGITLALFPGSRRSQAQEAAAPDVGEGPFKLEPLPYAYDALEPHIDEKTMRIHHDKHHAAYVRNMNKAIQGQPTLEKMELEAILRDLNAVPDAIRRTVRNNGGGDYNHTLFWKMMKPGGGGAPSAELAEAITTQFGSFEDFQKAFTAEAMGVFGSGWAWLVWDGTALAITSTPNQDSPIFTGQIPILGLDVWEHAYYLKNQNRRAEYVEAWWNVVNWDYAAQRFQEAKTL